MRLRKGIISVALAACMAVTTLPSGVQLKAMAAETTEMPEIPKVAEQPEDMVNETLVQEEPVLMPEVLQEEIGKEVPEGDGYGIEALAGEEDTNVNHLSRKYIPTGETDFSFTLHLTEKPYTDESDNNHIAYLFDKDDKIAAKSVKSVSASVSGTGCNIYFNGVYRTRELNAGEELYVGYSSNNGEVHRLKGVTLTVTDQPYIYSVYRSYGLYSGEDDTSIIDISGYNIDFSKLSVSLKDEITGDIVAASVRCIERYKEEAYCLIKWNNPEDQYNSDNYTVEYNYTADGINLVAESGAGSYSNDIYNNSAIWNDKTNTVEYYNREIPAGTEVSYEIKEYSTQADSCVSGSGITVSDSHLIKINLKDELLSDYYRDYYLLVKYKDGEQEKSCESYFYKYEERIIWWHTSDSFYTLGDTEIEISAEIHSNDVLNNETKLVDTCKVNIFKGDTGISVGEMELKLKKEGNKILYYGIFNSGSGLGLGRYMFSFSPDGEHKLRYAFYVYDSSKLYLRNQDNHIEEGTITVGFGSPKAAEWYCKNIENLNKFRIKILDIEGNEIGTYKYSNGDFTVDDNKTSYAYININFTDKVKEALASIYYCNVYFYYGDIDTDNTIAKYAYYEYEEYENFYNQPFMPSLYLRRDSDISSIFIGTSIIDGNIYYGPDSYNVVSGSDSAFPIKLTITDWYSLKTVKEITINEPMHIFTESELDGLSLTNRYNFFLKGADGSVNKASGYIGTGSAGNGEEDKPSPVPTPTSKPPVSGGSSGGIGGYVPSVNNGGTAPVQPTTAPTTQPEVTASPAPTAVATIQPTAVPSAAPTVQPSTVPEPSVAPVATAPPADIKEPGNMVVNPYTPAPEEKTELVLKKKKITLKKGQKAKIKITSKLSTDVIYKSLKPSIATVSKKGVITAKKAGKAVITVKANGQVKKVEVTVKDTKKASENTVKTSSSVKLNKNFKLAKTSVTLNKGKKLTIQKASGLSGKVTFSSLDKKIASVSVNGVVKAKKKGKTTILIKNGKKTIKLKVTVKK